MSRPARRTIQVFAAPSDASRVRRATDAIVVVAGAALVTLLAIPGQGRSRFDGAFAQLVADLPGFVQWMGEATYLLGIAYGLALLVGVAIVARRRLGLARDLALAALLAMVLATALTWWTDRSWPDITLADLDGTATTFPALLLTALVAVQATAASNLTRPMRRVGWLLTIGAMVGGLVGGLTQLRPTTGAVLVGGVAAAVVRLALGTSAGIPSLGRIDRGLRDLGLEVTDLAYTEDQPSGSTFVSGRTDDGPTITARVDGRDAWNGRFLTRAWRFAWYEDGASDLTATRREQMEHEALCLLVAERGGVAVPGLRAVGITGDGDAVAATTAPGPHLSTLPADEITDDLLGATWREVARLHDLDVSHGRLDADHVAVADDGSPVLLGFDNGSVGATREERLHDVAVLLTATAVIVGTDRAIAAARPSVDDADLADALALLQPAAMPPALRHEARHRKFKVADLRAATAEALGAETPELQKIQRVSLAKVGMLAILAIAAYAVISALGDVGLQTVLDSFSNASWGLVIVALVLVQFTNFFDAVSLAAAAPRPVPVGVTTVEQFAIGFVNLAVPSTAGRIAVDVRYFQGFGVGAAASTTASAITSLANFAAQILLFTLTAVGGNESLDWANLQSDGAVKRLLALAVGLAVVGLIVVVATPKLRRWIADKIRGPLSDIRQGVVVLKDPRTVAVILGGKLADQLIFAGGLTICVYAVGGEVGFAEVVFINTVVSLFAGMMPVPGGVGVTEAGLTAGLTAVGVDNATALSAVLIYRLSVFYLPPIWGFFCMQWLRRHDYL